jgi:hypothetical protein
MSLTQPHPDYLTFLHAWRLWRDAYAGEEAVKARGEAALPRPAGMKKPKQYAEYKLRATWYGATTRTVDGVLGLGFRQAPEIQAPDALQPIMDDATLGGISLVLLAESQAREQLLMGRTGVLVDYDDLGARPYCRAYVTEDILNWRREQRGAQVVTTLVVLREREETARGAYPADTYFVPQVAVRYRVLRLNEAGLYEVSLWEQTQAGRGAMPATVARLSTTVPVRLGEPLTTIPFFTAPNLHVQSSPLDGLIRANYAHYRHSADYEHGLHLTALPTPWVTGFEDDGTELLIGSQAAWTITNPDARVGMLEFQGSGLTPHEHALEQDLKNMATLGSRLLETTPTTQETATVVLLRSAGNDAPLQTLLRQVSAQMTTVLRWLAWWQGLTDDLTDPALHLTISTDLQTATMAPQLLHELVIAWQAGGMSFATFYEQLRQGELTRAGVDALTEQDMILVERAARGLVRQPVATNGQGT